MFKRVMIVGLVVAVVLGAIAWFNRAAIISHIAIMQIKATHVEVAPHKPVVWDQGPETPEAPLADRPPNIVFILLDDLGYNDISTFGGGVAGGKVPTPNIDRLAAQGAIFNQAYSGTGTCAPSRAMLMTGRYPTRTGFEFTPTPDGMTQSLARFANSNERDDDGLPSLMINPDVSDENLPYADQGLPSSEITVAEVLKERGYHTVHIGKWHLGQREDFSPNAQGFDESVEMANMLYLPEDHPDVVNAKLDFDPIDQFLWARAQFAAKYNGGPLFEPGGYLTDWWTDESLKVIEANRNRPFFLYMAHWGPHTPLQATKADYEAVGDIKPHRLRVYAAMIRALDRSVGRIMDKLEAEGLADNTMIVLSSDNGGAGYLGLPEVNAPFRGWKITLFEGGIRVPMLVSWPGQIKPGTKVNAPVAHIDLLPTLAAAAGASPPTDRVIDGRNILPAAISGAAIERPDDAIFWQSGDYQVVRAADWKLHVDGLQKKIWLFNLANDPTEQKNLASQQPKKVAELKALLAAHQADAVAPLYPFKIASPILIDKTIIDPRVKGDEYVIWPN